MICTPDSLGRMLRTSVLLFLTVTVAAAQIPGAPPEIATRESPVTFKTGTSLVSVPVVVRDSRGRAVGNLVRDDFQLFENGKPQRVSRFSVERLGAISDTGPAVKSQPVIPDHFLAYLFDDLNLRPNQLIWLRDAVLDRLSASASPFERTAIYTTSGRNTLDFTADQDRLRQTLLSLAPGGARSDFSSGCPPMTAFMADLIVNRQDTQALAVGIADYTSCAGPAPGGAEKVVLSTARQVLELTAADAGRVLDAMGSIIGKLAAMPGQRSLLVASPGFLVFDNAARDKEAAVIDRALAVNVIVHAFDARGLTARIPGGDASSRIGAGELARLKIDYERRSDLQSGAVLADVAGGTGGRFFENTNDARGALARVAPPEYLYLLGFDPGNFEPDGKFRALKVTLRNRKELSVEARRGYYARRYEADPEQHDRQQIEESIFSRQETRDLPVDLQVQFSKTAESEATVTALARIDIAGIPFRREDNRNRDDITLVVALFDGNGNYLSGVRKILEMRLRDETLRTFGPSGYSVRTDFHVGPGSYLVRLVALDSEGKRMAARSGVVEIQ